MISLALFLFVGVAVQKTFGYMFEDGWPYWTGTVVWWAALFTFFHYM